MILVTGGVRSGKSSFAEQLARQYNAETLYVATSNIEDQEMQHRVTLHQQQRPKDWKTYEGYRNLGTVVEQMSQHYAVILLECITTLVSNLLWEYSQGTDIEQIDFLKIELQIQQEMSKFIEATQVIKNNHCQLIVVTNEIGLGVVPDNLLARHFRDIAGRINQQLAAEAEQVFFVVSGIPIKIKG